MSSIRPCDAEDRDVILEIVNAAAQAYRGVIPADRWHEPYMSGAELTGEIDAGVRFSGYQTGDGLLGVMGIQDVRDVQLIRHAYVSPAAQGRGVGGALLEHLQRVGFGPMLVGTWAAADWAIRFYERRGFRQVDPAEKDRLLTTYWTIPDRQIATSVVLVTDPPETTDRLECPTGWARSRDVSGPRASSVRVVDEQSDLNPV